VVIELTRLVSPTGTGLVVGTTGLRTTTAVAIHTVRDRGHHVVAAVLTTANAIGTRIVIHVVKNDTRLQTAARATATSLDAITVTTATKAIATAGLVVVTTSLIAVTGVMMTTTVVGGGSGVRWVRGRAFVAELRGAVSYRRWTMCMSASSY
jgi:hypothetical protein